ncbi:hypothetical protein BBJ28_00020796 [Nothophytophthora sp. Chile5]|nr:hypothetical protein BBJ28_00020796 [Nothophytophthora sp. Chile5]
MADEEKALEAALAFVSQCEPQTVDAEETAVSSVLSGSAAPPFLRAHSLELPESRLQSAETELDSDFYATQDFLDVCVAEELWGQLMDSPVDGDSMSAAVTAVETAGGSSTCAAIPPVEDDADASVASAAAKSEPNKPKTQRISPKQRLEDLREEVKELTAQLQALGTFPPSEARMGEQQTATSAVARRAQLWEQIATRQLERRHQAEEKNAQLRGMVQLQIQEAKNLRRILKRRTKIEMMGEMLGLKRHKSQLSSRVLTSTKEENSRVFDEMLQAVDQLYAKINALFAEKGMHDVPCPGRKRQVMNGTINGVALELLERNIVPFSTEMTEQAVWAALGQLELQGLECVSGFTADVQFHAQNSAEGSDTSMVSFFAAHPGGAGKTGVQVRKVVRKYVEAHRTVFVYRTLMEPKVSADLGPVGVHSTSTLLVDVQKGGTLDSGDKTSVIQSHFTATRHDLGLPVAQRLRLPANLDMAIAVWDESVARIYHQVESFLVDETCKKRSTNVAEVS